MPNHANGTAAPAAATHVIVLFDGVCHLCTGTVVFILKRDRRARFRFAALQSETGQRLLAAHGVATTSLATMVVIDGGRAYTRSDAALRIAARLGRFWPVLGVFRVLPRGLRDALYNVVARYRYRWFGRHPACWLPPGDVADRFLD